MSMLSQTKDAITALKACGLQRHEFRVRTPWNAQIQGYDEPIITLLCPRERWLALLPAFARHVKTVVLTRHGTPVTVLLEPGSRPGIFHREVDR
jgi:hypothetical protein